MRIAEEHAGKRAKCPICGAMTDVAAPAGPGDASESLPAAWSLKTPEGRVYGPVTLDALERWVREGRVTDACMIRCEDASWQGAAERYPVLGQARTAVVNAESIDAPSLEPHRGPIILALGIVSWVVICPGFGVFAWVLGTRDLERMRAGWMDPGGAATTQTGQVLGMVNCVAAMLGVLAGLFAWLASVI